jgi:hypothetical protein
MTDCTSEFPTDWFIRTKLTPQGKRPHLDYFGVDASQPLCARCALRRKSIVLRHLSAEPTCGYDGCKIVSRQRPRISRNVRRVGAS